jgi:hypothetical protein
MQEVSMNIIENLCSVIAMPIELILRPWHGTRYYPITVRFFSPVMMLFVPAFAAMATGVAGMIPFAHVQPPRGMFGFGSFTMLYFLLLIIHNIRLWIRMMHLERELHSEFEGPPLPVFYLLTKGQNFWFTRIVWEPAFVLLASTVLTDFFIIQPGLAWFLRLMAFCLCMKNFIGWYRSWEYIRRILDMKNAAPIINRLVDNEATPEELAPIHLASFPKDIAPDIRRAAAAHIAHSYSPENANL